MSWGYWFWDINIICPVIYRIFLNRKDQKSLFLFVSCLHMFIFLAVRSSYTGVDSVLQYPDVFLQASRLSFSELMSKWSFISQMRLGRSPADSGYALLNWIFGHLLGLPYRAFLVWFSFFDAYCAYQYLKHNSESPLLGIMIIIKMLFLAYCQAYRRMMAMDFFFLAFIQMEKKHYKKALGLMFVAFTMHRSSLIMWAFLILPRIKITKELFLRVAIFAALSSLIPPSVITGSLTGIFEIFGKSGYFAKGTEGLEVILSSYSYRMLGIIYIVIMAGMYFFLDFRILQTPANNLLCWIFLFYVGFSSIDSAFPIISQEIGFYFRPSIFLFFANILAQRRENPYIRSATWLVFLFVLLAAQHYSTVGDFKGVQSMYHEYKTMFQTRNGF